ESVPCSYIYKPGGVTKESQNRLFIFDDQTQTISLLDYLTGEIVDRYHLSGELKKAFPVEIPGLNSALLIISLDEIVKATESKNDLEEHHLAQIIHLDGTEHKKLKLYWSRRIPGANVFNALVADFNYDGTYSLMMPGANDYLHIYPINPLSHGETQFRGDRLIFDKEKWLNPSH
ncbi:hypothetical protein KKB99_05275, partial [bacterium]|nr:hypothetical protein [bacterium]MBU1025408.1 hypothetical protein [bacterium]